MTVSWLDTDDRTDWHYSLPELERMVQRALGRAIRRPYRLPSLVREQYESVARDAILDVMAAGAPQSVTWPPTEVWLVQRGYWAIKRRQSRELGARSDTEHATVLAILPTLKRLDGKVLNAWARNGANQKATAEELGRSEPSVSRSMARVLDRIVAKWPRDLPPVDRRIVRAVLKEIALAR
jgi:hypothetical protein